MKPIYILLACFLLPGVVEAQTSSPNPDSSAHDTNLATEAKALREALLQTQKQMAAQQRGPLVRSSGQSKNAHLSMVYAGFRYVLPSTAGTLRRVPYPN
jgi:hypothetical protein